MQGAEPPTLERVKAEAVPITGFGIEREPLPGSSAAGVPVVHVDASRRPDLVDLQRDALRERYTRKRPRSAHWWVTYGEQGRLKVALWVEYSSPARCSFALAFDFAEQHDAIAAINRAGAVAVSTVPPGEALEVLVLGVEPYARLAELRARLGLG